MANCGYQCTDLPDHEQVVCGEYLKGGISAVGILECDYTITDFSSAGQYTTNINNGNLTIIEPVVAEVPAAAPVEGANPSGCGSATILDSFDRTVTITDYNVTAANVAFYNALNRRKSFLILYHCHDDMVTAVLKLISWTAVQTIPANEREKQFWTITGKWTDMDAPNIYDAPVGIFSQAN